MSSISGKSVGGAKSSKTTKKTTEKNKIGQTLQKFSPSSQAMLTNTASKSEDMEGKVRSKSKSLLAFEKQQKAKQEAQAAKQQAQLESNLAQHSSGAVAKTTPKQGMAQPKYLKMMEFLNVIPRGTQLGFNLDKFKWELPPDTELPAKFDLTKKEMIANALPALSLANGFNQVLKTLLDHNLIDKDTFEAAAEEEANLAISLEDADYLDSLKVEFDQMSEIPIRKHSNQKRISTSNSIEMRQYYQPKHEKLVQKAHLANLKALELLKARYAVFKKDTTDSATIEAKLNALVTNETMLRDSISNDEKNKHFKSKTLSVMTTSLLISTLLTQ